MERGQPFLYLTDLGTPCFSFSSTAAWVIKGDNSWTLCFNNLLLHNLNIKMHFEDMQASLISNKHCTLCSV